MNQKLINRVTAARTVVSFCNTPSSIVITAPITAFAGEVLTVSNKLVLIDGYNQIVLKGTKGVTIDTRQMRKTMTDLAFKCAQATLGFANSQNNSSLADSVNYSMSALDAFTKEEISDVCAAIRKATDVNIDGASLYGITDADVTDLQAAIDLYLVATSNPRQAVITRKMAGDQIKKLVKEIYAYDFKKQMDVMVNTLLISNPKFVANYFAAREILDLGSTITKLRGTVTAPDNHPLLNVSVTLRLPGQSAISYQTHSLINGSFEIVGIIPGNYDISYQLPGFISYFENNNHFKPGTEIIHHIILQPVILLEPA